jgi:hypothetical protein
MAVCGAGDTEWLFVGLGTQNGCLWGRGQFEWLFNREIMNLKITVVYTVYFDLDQ